MVLTEFEQMEQTYLDEYHKLHAKDKANNKDLNKMALTELKQAHLFFAYMKTSEKLYNMELKKKSEIEEKERIAAMTPQEKIQEVNEDFAGKADKILDSVTNPSAGRTPTRLERKDLTSTKKYDKFRSEFADVFESVYADPENKETHSQARLKERFDKEKPDYW